MTTTASVVITGATYRFPSACLACILGRIHTGHGEIVMFIAVIGSILSLAILASESFALRVIRSTATLPLLKKLTPKLEVLYLSMAKLVTPWPLLAATAISIAAWGCECVGFYLVIDALPNTSPDLGEATFIYSFATIFGAITLLPGGLGYTTEGSLVGLTHSVFGLATKQSAGAAALIIRFVPSGLQFWVQYFCWPSGAPLHQKICCPKYRARNKNSNHVTPSRTVH